MSIHYQSWHPNIKQCIKINWYRIKWLLQALLKCPNLDRFPLPPTYHGGFFLVLVYSSDWPRAKVLWPQPSSAGYTQISLCQLVSQIANICYRIGNSNVMYIVLEHSYSLNANNITLITRFLQNYHIKEAISQFILSIITEKTHIIV